jgi:lysophospholipase L1-like esterase
VATAQSASLYERGAEVKSFIWWLKFWQLAPGGLLCAALILAGCEGGNSGHIGDGHDFGPNNPNLYVSAGDSITAGVGLTDPNDCYTVKLAGMLGKTVVNKGFPGFSSGELLDQISPILDDYKPGYLLILIGINDMIMGYGEDVAAANIRIIIQECKDNKTIPVIATLTPVGGDYVGLSSGVRRLNDLIRQIASDLSVPLVDLDSAFNGNTTYLQDDGLHPTAAGHALMAVTFYDVVN